MRIVIDVQSVHTGSRDRGIGRYVRHLTRALIKDSQHEVLLVLDGRFAAAVKQLRRDFADLLPASRIRAWQCPRVPSVFERDEQWRTRAAEILREGFISQLEPDLVLVGSLFEGGGGEAVTSIGVLPNAAPTAVILYDLTPLRLADAMLVSPPVRDAYDRKLESLKRADLILAISDSSRRDGIDMLGLDPGRIVTIGAGADARFAPLAGGEAETAKIRASVDAPDGFVFYYGGFDPHKNVARLIDAFSRLPADMRSATPLLLSGGLASAHVKPLKQKMAEVGLSEIEVRFLGRVEDERLRHLIGAASLVIFPSLWEGFGLPVLEAMQVGAPVVCSNVSSLPEVIGREDATFDPHDPASIARKMRDVLRDAAFRAELASYGRERAQSFSWEQSARKTLCALEAAPRRAKARAVGDAATSLAVSHAIAAIAPSHGQDAFWEQCAFAIAANRLGPGGRLLIDVTGRATAGSGGIARIADRLYRALTEIAPIGLEIIPVEIDARARTMVLALAAGSRDAASVEIAPEAGDVLFGLGLHYDLAYGRDLARRFREAGGSLHAIIYDLLPIQRPDWFPPHLGDLHARWLSTLADWDQLICLSSATAGDLRSFLASQLEPDETPVVSCIRLGADLADRARRRYFPEFGARPSILHVSRISRGKGHLQTLAAFERLWRQGEDVNYVMAGRIGFGMDDLPERLRAHPEYQHRLFWFENAQDMTLAQLHDVAAGVIAPSEAEGFGLRVVEAARFRKPLLCRDLPVFRDIIEDRARYFSGLEPEPLAAALRPWLAELAHGTAPRPNHNDVLSWRHSAAQVLERLGFSPKQEVIA